MGRRKIEIKPIRDDRNRSVTFLKRKGGLFKKAHELSVLCSVDVAVIIFGTNKKLYEYSSSDVNEIIGRFQYYGGAHEHKGPADFANKGGTGDDDEDDEGGEEAGEEQKRGTPVPPEQPGMVAHPQMQNHPGFQHVRQGTPGAAGSPPMHNGALPQQFVRGPSPLPPGISRPASRTQDHPGHVRRVSSNLVPPHMQQTQGPPPQPSYAYTPNPPFYNPQAAAQMQQRPVPQGHQATYPPPYPPQPPLHQQVQQVYMQEARRQSGPPAFPPQPPPQANMQRHPTTDHLQPPQPRPHPSPQPGQGPRRPSPSPQPHQREFASPPIPQPRPLPANKAQSIFTPIDDTRSMLAQHWGATSNIDASKIDPAIKLEGGPRSASVDIAAIHREKQNAGRLNGAPSRPPPNRMMRSPQPPQRASSTTSMPAAPTRSNTAQTDAKRPRLKVHIPSEQSGDEGGTESALDDATTRPSRIAAPIAERRSPPISRRARPHQPLRPAPTTHEPFAGRPPAMLQTQYYSPPTPGNDEMDSPTDSLSSLSLEAKLPDSVRHLPLTPKQPHELKTVSDPIPHSTTDPSPSSLMDTYFANTHHQQQPTRPTSSHRNRSPYNRSHLRSRSGNAALLSAPAMTRAHSMPNPHISRSALAENGTVAGPTTSTNAPPPPAAPRSPMRTPARVRSPFREDGGYAPPPPPRSPGFATGGAIESIQEDSELDTSTLGHHDTLGPLPQVPAMASFSRSGSLRRRSASPLHSLTQAPPTTASTNMHSDSHTMYSSSATNSPSLGPQRFTESYPTLHHYGSTSSFASSVPSTPTSVRSRSRSPSISSLDTLDEAPNMESEALEADQLERLKLAAERQ
ncbi:resistance to lethality of mkk1p386 overexpression, partial [Friedmanniomyces endolithicus]